MSDNHFEKEELGPEGSYYDAVRKQEEDAKRRKDDAMFPLIISITYLVLGCIFKMWHPGWLLFFAIPLHYMRPNSTRELLLNPVSITLIFLILGFFFNLWHPGWLVFLLIPLNYVGK